MHFYWRVQADLDEIGSLLILNHPNLSREFEKWVKRNADGLAVAQGICWESAQAVCFNMN